MLLSHALAGGALRAVMSAVRICEVSAGQPSWMWCSMAPTIAAMAHDRTRMHKINFVAIFAKNLHK
ncbi:MAG: hypothetical protein A2061_01080 [Gallionellales bacterium GWA2_59_43]|nr:MAG: hypothetical protein A2061_01080 [Gallionellales bacterium GWA2_59_43]